MLQERLAHADPADPSAALHIRLSRAVAEEPGATLACLGFGSPTPGAIAHAGLRVQGGQPVFESWCGPQVRATGESCGVAWRASAELLFGVISLPAENDMLAVSREVYQRLFKCTVEQNFPHLLRIWNFIPGINQGEGDGETYKRFCVGRGLALDQFNRSHEIPPAATAVGAGDSDELLVYFMASRTPGVQLENTRQVSAFDYPRQYGQRSPRFSRAICWSGAGEDLLFVSGTASVVGHESRHEGDVYAQLQEAWRNLERLCELGSASAPRGVRAYVRHLEDLDEVHAFVRHRLGDCVPLVCLQSDICRQELLIEIEGLFEREIAR